MTEPDPLLNFYLIFTLVGSALLILGYLWTLIHTICGSKYKFVIELLIMLVLSNAGTILMVYTNFQLFAITDKSETFVWLLGLSIFVQDCMFCVSHLMLAHKYRGIAFTIPYLLERKRPPLEPMCSILVYSILITLNILFPLLECMFLVPFNKQALVYDKQANIWLTIAVACVCISTGVLQMITGVILVGSVFKIRAFFKLKKREGFVNMKILVFHSLTFILFLVSAFFNYLCLTIYIFSTQSDKSLDTYTWASIFYQVFSIISQAFLTGILWDLGREKKQPQRDGKKYVVRGGKARQLHKPT